MITSSGLSLFYGPETLVVTLSGETDGRLYGGVGGDYIYKTSMVYQINYDGVTPIYRSYAGGMTNIDNLIVIGTPYFPTQRFYSRPTVSTSGWTLLTTVTPSGVCNYMLSDDGDGIPEIPLLTGNISSIGNRIDKIISLTSSIDSDIGIPQTTSIALITDLEAAI